MSSKSKKSQRIPADELSEDSWTPLEHTRSRVNKELRLLRQEKKRKKILRHRRKHSRATRT